MLTVGVVGIFLSGLMFCIEGGRALGWGPVVAQAATLPAPAMVSLAQPQSTPGELALAAETPATISRSAQVTSTPVASLAPKLASALSAPAELSHQSVAIEASAPRSTPQAEVALYTAAAPAARPAPKLPSSAHRLVTTGGQVLPCTDCDMGFGEGIYRLVDLHAAARVLQMDPDDLSGWLWAGGTLYDLVTELGADLDLVRDVVDAERYRALVNSDYLRDGRPELCCSGPDCPSVCSSSESAGCGIDCGAARVPSGGWFDPSSGSVMRPSLELSVAPAYRVTASGGLRLRRGPGTSYSVACVVAAGTILPSTGEARWVGTYQWVEVIFNDQYLWAAAIYLEPLPGI
ncbi:MAG: hypothetical protein JXA74_02720 [Anaerolineae bacterium]|nr:hypothetical protein [Anaerolineae bacterium]